MKFLRPLLALAVLLILIVAVCLWWSTPSRVDMANYAPADSLVYVEFNNLEDVATRNIAKLRARYPERFETELSLSKDEARE